MLCYRTLTLSLPQTALPLPGLKLAPLGVDIIYRSLSLSLSISLSPSFFSWDGLAFKGQNGDRASFQARSTQAGKKEKAWDKPTLPSGSFQGGRNEVMEGAVPLLAGRCLLHEWACGTVRRISTCWSAEGDSRRTSKSTPCSHTLRRPPHGR